MITTHPYEVQAGYDTARGARYERAFCQTREEAIRAEGDYLENGACETTTYYNAPEGAEIIARRSRPRNARK